MAQITGNLIFKTTGPLSLAVFTVSDVNTGDTFEAADGNQFTHVKNAIFYPVTIDSWIDVNSELPLESGSLTNIQIATPDLNHEAGWLVIVGS